MYSGRGVLSTFLFGFTFFDMFAYRTLFCFYIRRNNLFTGKVLICTVAVPCFTDTRIICFKTRVPFNLTAGALLGIFGSFNASSSGNNKGQVPYFTGHKLPGMQKELF
jgi:hypothetical protein